MMLDAKLSRAYATLAGITFIAIAVLGVPVAMLIEPQPAAEAYLLNLVAALTGIVVIALPWERLDPRALHLVAAVATVETAAAVQVFGPIHAVLYFLVAIAAAYAAPSARSFAVQVGLIVTALFAPVALEPGDSRAALHTALVVAPVLVAGAATFAYLRQQLVSGRQAHRQFAEQTLLIAERIAGHRLDLEPHGEPRVSLPPPLSRRPPLRLLVPAGLVAAAPLLIAGLAVGGVRVPEFANDRFRSVGIELPNQEHADTANPSTPVPASGLRGERRQGEGRDRELRLKVRPAPKGATAEPAPAAAGSQGPAPVTGTDPVPPQASQPPASSGPGPPPESRPALGDRARDLVEPVSDLLEALGLRPGRDPGQ